MKLVFFVLLSVILLIAITAILFGILRTMAVQNDPRQKEFLGGTVPENLPDGIHKGIFSQKTTWQGKKFEASSSSGINIFKDDQGNITEKYPFKLSTGMGITDKNLKVLKIDYSQNKQPWWLKFILDEVVEVSPGKFLGKVHLNLIPNVPFTLGYFRLEK